MIDPTVRPAGTGDVDALRRLELEARDAVAASRGGSRWLDEHPAIAGGWPAAVERRAVFVAEVALDGDRSAIVGYVVVDLVADPMPVVVVDQVFVHPDARELGFGDALVAAAVDHGRRAGAELIEAQTLPGDREIKNLYERAGITARLITVSKRL